MRKLFAIFIVTLALIPAFAGDLFTFTAATRAPLYQEPVADPYAYQTKLQYMIATDPDLKPVTLRAVIKEKTAPETSSYVDLRYDDGAFKEKNKSYIHMKTATSIGLMRVRFNGTDILPSIEAELNLAGYVNTVFCAFEKNDTLGFDGSYFLGASMRVADFLTFRFGLHHFSGHYGDEVMSKFYKYNWVDFSGEQATIMYNGTEYYFNDMVEYVRDNSWLASVAAELPYGFRIYGEAELPKNPSWLRPLVHCPADYENPVDEARPTMIDRIGGNAADGEQFTQAQLDEQQELMRTAEGTYRAWRIHTGAEWRLKLGSFGSLFVAGDIQFHQDGQSKHQVGQYSKDNPWEIEYSVGGGVEMGQPEYGRSVRIEVYYHDGRVPTTNWFYSRTKLLTIGVGIY